MWTRYRDGDSGILDGTLNTALEASKFMHLYNGKAHDGNIQDDDVVLDWSLRSPGPDRI